jgi:23S rRNA (uracil1939-C5)-methyltransferase
VRVRTEPELSPAGAGLISAQGRPVEIPGALPGELIEVASGPGDRLTLREVIEPSPRRVDPGCPIYERCGGCTLRHLSYEAELAFKGRLAGRMLGQAPAEVVASPAPDEYRYRVRLRLGRRGPEVVPGFFGPASHRFVAVADCPVLAPPLRRILPRLREALAGPFFRRHAQRLDQAELAAGLETGSAVLVTWRLKPGAPRSVIKTLEGLDLGGVSGEVTVGDEAGGGRGGRPGRLGPSVLVLDHGPTGLKLRAGSGVFFQANLALNRRLVDLVLLKTRGSGPVLDLFCGLGNFTLAAAVGGGRPVTGVELNPRAVAWARENARAAGLRGIDLMEADAAAALDYLQPGRFETVVLDPPRRGAPEVTGRVAALGPERVIYVSCRPETLGRDLRAMTGYGLEGFTLLDLFPRTLHLEVVAVLNRR